MNEFKLGGKYNKIIVEGILKGYKNYLEERRDKQKSMNVSGAYAWTKGNHIDDQVSKIDNEQNIKFSIAKAGYTWEYLEFNINENKENYMLIIKNSKKVKESLEEQKQKRKKTNYLAELSAINTNYFKDNSDYIDEPQQIQFELSDLQEINSILEGTQLQTSKKYSRFYIATYEIDDETKYIRSIELTMPNPETMSLMRIENLTPLIKESEYEITPEDVDVIKNEQISIQSIYTNDENSFGYSVPATEEKKEESGN